MPDESPKQFTFTIKQLLSLISGITVLSGGGAAVTVKASDQLQDSKIAKLEAEQSKVAEKLDKTTREVTEVSVKVTGVEKQVDQRVGEVRDDIKDLRDLIIRSIERHE